MNPFMPQGLMFLAITLVVAGGVLGDWVSRRVHPWLGAMLLVGSTLTAVVIAMSAIICLNLP